MATGSEDFFAGFKSRGRSCGTEDYIKFVENQSCTFC